MRPFYRCLLAFYGWILGLYPFRFRADYAGEMLLVFQMQLDDMPSLNLWRTLRIMWRELRPLPVLLIHAHLRERHIYMEFVEFDGEIRAAESNPQQLEEIYQLARRSDQAGAFRNALMARYQAAPDNVLLAAWYYRLQNGAEEARKSIRQTNWLIAVPLSILTGLIFWALSDVENLKALDLVPHLLLWWSPVATMGALIYMAVTAGTQLTRALVLGASVLVATLYGVVVAPSFDQAWASEQYLIIAAIHVPLLCWAALGAMALRGRSSAADRFAFLIKSIEVAIVAGLYLLAGIAFGGITIGMFDALSVELPEVLLRLIAAGGFGLLPVLALATVYDPAAAPSAQDFDQGLSRLIATLMRLLLPLTLIVLVIYLLVIPFNFMAPFENRDVLIVYNAMLFAIVGLLVGTTPIRRDDLSAKSQQIMRNSIIAVAGLAVLVSIYALAAVVHRTLQGELTLNRLAVIGWNAINIGILVTVIVTQLRAGVDDWIGTLQSVFSRATVAYLAWSIFLLVVPPILL
ncbi:MAG: hypothetical protein LC121_07200 [Anaerolineae bacterium]|nr:hypothetical protein [Anaerolineae bacterium]